MWEKEKLCANTQKEATTTPSNLLSCNDKFRLMMWNLMLTIQQLFSGIYWTTLLLVSPRFSLSRLDWENFFFFFDKFTARVDSMQIFYTTTILVNDVALNFDHFQRRATRKSCKSMTDARFSFIVMCMEHFYYSHLSHPHGAFFFIVINISSAFPHCLFVCLLHLHLFYSTFFCLYLRQQENEVSGWKMNVYEWKMHLNSLWKLCLRTVKSIWTKKLLDCLWARGSIKIRLFKKPLLYGSELH